MGRPTDTDGLPFESEISDAGWVLGSLETWSWPVRLASFMPAGFEAYVRVLHAFVWSDREGARFVTWADMAAEHGIELRPDVTAHEVCGMDSDHGAPLPEEGRLPESVCQPLVRVLRRHTDRPAECWFGIWDGWGRLTPGVLLMSGRPSLRQQVSERRAERRSRRAYAAIPRLRGHGRDYLLLRRPLDAACALEIRRREFVPPSIWWPADRAWTVVTEIDGYSTYVGGTHELIESILEASELEALRCSRDAAIG